MRALHVFGFLLMAAIPMYGADTDPVKFFKLDFTTKELDGNKTISSHTYSVRAGADKGGSASIRTGSRVPYNNAYIDAGINFDIHNFSEAGGEVSLDVVADISSFVENPERPQLPVIRQNKWVSKVSAKIGKPTMIFSSDDLSSKHQIIVEFTATPIH